MASDPKHISISDFEKIELRVGTIKAVKKHPKLDDYIVLVNLGKAERDLQIVANLRDRYTLRQLIGKQVCVVVNIKEKMVGGFESQGLLLMTTREGKSVLLKPDRAVHPGVKVYGMYDSKKTHHSEIGR